MPPLFVALLVDMHVSNNIHKIRPIDEFHNFLKDETLNTDHLKSIFFKYERLDLG